MEIETARAQPHLEPPTQGSPSEASSRADVSVRDACVRFHACTIKHQGICPGERWVLMFCPGERKVGLPWHRGIITLLVLRERRWFVLERPRRDTTGGSETEVTVTSKQPSKYRKKQGDRKETEKRREGRIRETMALREGEGGFY